VGCFGSEQDWPLRVPAHASGVVRITVSVRNAVEFDEALGFAVADCAELRVLPIAIRGRGVPKQADGEVR
jgi:hypothetical protein